MEKYGKSDAALKKGGAKDKSAYSDMGGAKVSGERKAASLDAKGEVKKKDLSSYSGAGIQDSKKQAGA